jgi:hypothetical protein
MNESRAPFRSLPALLVAGACLLAPPALAQSLKDQLVGTWKLVSSTRQVGGVAQPWLFGTNSTGTLVYTADGHMCGNLMNLDRPNFPSGDMRGGSAGEKAAAFDTFLAYCGRYEVNEAGRFVVHKIDSSLFPNWTGGSQKRHIELNGNRLALRTEPILADGKEVVAVVAWERAQQK